VISDVKAICFDFDMTLVDSSYGITHCMNLLARDRGLREVSREEVLATIGDPIRVAWEKLWGEFHPQWVDIYRERFRGEEAARMRPYPDARPVLERLRKAGIRIGLVSNRTCASAAVQGAGMTDLFETVIGLENVKNPKPHPEPLLKGMEDLGACAAETIYVGDTDLDMMTAVAAGVRGVGITTGNFDAPGLRKAGAWRTVDSLLELEALVTQKIRSTPD
jgi:HAD superfamily hydrolase (TIGR01509 family)